MSVLEEVRTVNKVSYVADLEEMIHGMSEEPVTIAVSSLSVRGDELHIPDHRPLDMDDLAQERLCKFFKLPARYIDKCGQDLRAANFNYWFDNSGEGQATLYSVGSSLTGISDPNKNSLPLISYLQSIVSEFKPDDEVVEFHTEPGYLHCDVVSRPDPEVPGQDIIAGLRLLAYPDLVKAPEVYSYLYGQNDGIGVAVAEPTGKISLKGLTAAEVSEELRCILFDLTGRLHLRQEEYTDSASIPILGDFSHFLYHLVKEQELSKAVAKRILDLGHGAQNPTLFTTAQIFGAVANESVNYTSRLKLQQTAGYLVSQPEAALNRCGNCMNAFVDYSSI